MDATTFYAYHFSKKQLYYICLLLLNSIIYGIKVYESTTSSGLSKSQRLQNKTLKVLNSKDWLTHTKLLHSELKLL